MTVTHEARPAPAPEIRRDPPERMVRILLPACAGIWTAAELMHLAKWPGAAGVALGTLGVAGLTYGVAAHKWGRRKNGRAHARHVLTGITLAGGWMTAAVGPGPLGLPYHLLTGTLAAGSLAGWWWLRRHELVVAAREWREARMAWLGACRRWGLGGSHLLHHERTRLGERMIVDVKGTGKRASQFAHSDVAERIAEERNLPASRVLVKPHRLAGRVEISIRELDPWANPITHPVLCENPEITLAVPCSARKPVEIGQDPETGRVLPLPVWDERGGKNITVVSIKGGGKTVLLNNASERVTAASDALMIRINLSIKGLAEARRWGPACHLTAFGRHQQTRGLRVLRTVNKIIEFRARQHYETDVFVPSPADPLIVVIMDEADSAVQVPAIRQEVEDIARRGREYGVTLIRASQRGTAESAGGGNVRANDDVFCVGMVNRRGEAMHAAGDIGLSMPDMATYGEGHAGVWVIAELGGDQHIGRTFQLKDPGDIARIVSQRAHYQPELKPELKAFLGKTYEVLLSTDEYARWAREQQESAPVLVAAQSEAAPASSALAPASVATRTLDAYDREAEDYLDPELRDRLRRMDERNAETRRLIEETAAMPQPDVSHEDQVAHAAARWRQIGENTVIPDEHREILLGLLVGGVSASKVAAALGVTLWIARTYLDRLRLDGQAHTAGKGSGGRWLAGPEPKSGDAT